MYIYICLTANILWCNMIYYMIWHIILWYDTHTIMITLICGEVWVERLLGILRPWSENPLASTPTFLICAFNYMSHTKRPRSVTCHQTNIVLASALQQQQQQQQQQGITAIKDLCVFAPPFLRAPFPCLNVDTLFSEWCSRLHEVLLHPLCTETLVKWNAL